MCSSAHSSITHDRQLGLLFEKWQPLLHVEVYVQLCEEGIKGPQREQGNFPRQGVVYQCI